MTFFAQRANLLVYQGLPFSQVFRFDEPDPTAPQYTQPLDLTGYTLVGQVEAQPKVKAYGIDILADPPAPGLYVLALVYMGVTYTMEIEVLPGETAKELQEKILKALKNLDLPLSACAPSCADAWHIVAAWYWPGVEWSLDIVSQPDDDLDIDVQQENIPLLEFAEAAVVDGDYTKVTLTLTSEQTAGLPMAGDGPLRWRLVAVNDINPQDVKLLVCGLLMVART